MADAMAASGPTAGLRGAYWDPARMPDGVRLTVHPLKTQDASSVSGYLFARGGERGVVVLAHPREHLVPHYLVPEILRGGWAVFLQAPRLTGNDIRLEHEIALYDLAAALTELRKLGFEKTVALGNSGGGPLWAFYNQQSLLAPAERVAKTPGGRPTKLETADLPVLDAIMFVSAHLGQGRLLMNCIDPSVVDEGDAFSVDPALDPFSPANGYAPMGEARYADDFVARYRAAQVARVERIDAFARAKVADRASARAKLKAGNATPLDEARAVHTPIFPIWRTDADLRCWDVTIDPSDRPAGSVWSTNPYPSNYGSVGFGRVCTPESWLSTWSGLSSRASMEACAPAIVQPTLLVEYTGDVSTFPQEVDHLFSIIGTADKVRHAFPGDHHGRPLAKDAPNPKLGVGEAMRDWLADTF